MFSLQEFLPKFKQTVNSIIRVVKARRREEAALGLAAILFLLGYYFIKWLPEGLQGFAKSWKGDLIIPGVFYVAGLAFLVYGIYRIWKLVHVPDLPPPANRPSAIKGPLAFTPADGELFRKLGREDELRKLLGYIEDDQVRLVVLMGASGAGKTSLLRAGLTDILKGTDIHYHYWEAKPTDSWQGLLLALQQSWKTEANGTDGNQQPAPEIKSLDELVNPSPQMGKHVIVLDQFEQLGAGASGKIFQLLRKVARNAKPPHRVTWVIAFRREYRASWSDFIIPEQERNFFPPELSVRLFTAEQARDVISQLIEAAGLSVEQKVVGNLIEAATVEGEVSSVDIGIGLLVLSELHERQGAKTLTEDVYHFAGGAEGLLTQYINRCLENFPDEDRKPLLSAMLALRDEETNQRIADGKTAAELAAAIETTGNEAVSVSRLQTELERLTQRDIRLLERVTIQDGAEPRYRLPHERLIPAINRLAGKLIGEREEAKLKLVSAFSAWRNTRAAQYLLKGKDLRLVERYQSQIPWGSDEQEKLAFLKRSQRRRFNRRLSIAAALIVYIVLLGQWYSQYGRDEAERYLRENNYPPELYDYQHQLKTLELSEPLNLKYLPFLNSDTLEELTIKATPATNSLEGLADSLKRCTGLRKLTLDLSKSQVTEVPPLPNTLTELSLDLSNTQVENLSPLPNSLTKFSLKLDGSKVTKVPQLPNTLTELSLYLVGSKITEMPPLPNSVTELLLDFRGIDGQVRNLSSLPNSLTKLTLYNFRVSEVPTLPNTLKEFSFFNGGGEIKEVSPLPNTLTSLSLYLNTFNWPVVPPLPNSLTKLSLSFRNNEMKSLLPLPNSLTELSLTLSSDSELSQFLPLPNSLTGLSLFFNFGEVIEVPPLPNSLTEFSLTINNIEIQVENLSSLPNSLTKLTLYGVEVTEVPALPNTLKELSFTLTGDKAKAVPQLPNSLTKLSLDLSYSQVTEVPLLPNTLKELSLSLGNSQVKDLSPIQRLTNCQTLMLDLTTEQRMSLKTIPKSVTHLKL